MSAELPVRVISFEHRPERATAFRAALRLAAGAQFADRCLEVAVSDAGGLAGGPEIGWMFGGNAFAFRTAARGYAAGHVSIWRALAEGRPDQIELVFEDDARAVEGFERLLAAVLQGLRDGDSRFDLALLGYDACGGDTVPADEPRAGVRELRSDRYVGDPAAYLVSGRGARKLVEMAGRTGVRNRIDDFLLLGATKLDVLECDPPLAVRAASSGRDGPSSEPEPRVAQGRPRRPSAHGGVAIFCGPGWTHWHPLDIATRGLGGSETASYRLAEALAERGYAVTLYGDCDHDQVGDVLIRDWRDFCEVEPRQAVISSRQPQLFDGRIDARRLLWMHDAAVGDRLTPERAERTDAILCLSAWHRAHLAELYPFAASKLTMVRNGIMPGYFTTEPAPERRPRVLYTSAPDRGLDVLLELWPLVRERVPDAELVHSSAPVYGEQVTWGSDKPGVRSVAGLGQPQLAELMRGSLVWAHPSYWTPLGSRFDETSCIGAMEAQAAGCCVVAAGWGALRETVQVGTLIDGDPAEESFRARFADAIVAGLTDERVQSVAQTEGPEIALEWGWDAVAEIVAALF